MSTSESPFCNACGKYGCHDVRCVKAERKRQDNPEGPYCGNCDSYDIEHGRCWNCGSTTDIILLDGELTTI